MDRRLTDFRPHDFFCNARFVGDPVRELIPGRRLGNPGGDRQHLPEELPPAFVLPEVEPRRRLVQQILQIRLRPPQALPVFVRPRLRMNVSGSSPLSSTTTLTSKPSATSRSHERAAAPWPAASGS